MSCTYRKTFSGFFLRIGCREVMRVFHTHQFAIAVHGYQVSYFSIRSPRLISRFPLNSEFTISASPVVHNYRFHDPFLGFLTESRDLGWQSSWESPIVVWHMRLQ